MKPQSSESKVNVSPAALRQAEAQIDGCERCDPRADTPFYWLLDSTVGSAGSSYVLPARAHCQACGSEVGMQTRVRWS